MTRRALAAAALAASTAFSGPDHPPPASAWPLAVQRLTSAAPAGSAQPQLTVSARGVLLSWVERDGDTATLRFAERNTGGWSAPRTVASGTDWFVNWADVPSALRLANGTIVAHWLQKSGPGTYAYDVRLAYSTDDGRRWSPSFTPHHDGTKTEHGFASLFELPQGGVGVVWLDGRAMKSAGGHAHGPGAQGAMSLRFAAFDRQWKQTAETVVDARVCECCPTAAAVTSEGPVAAFRDRSGEEVRDIHVARFDLARWLPGRAVHDDGWRIPACPVNGPAISAEGRRVAVAWFTMQAEEGRTFLAFSEDAGRTFGGPIRLDDGGSLGRVDVQILPDGSAAAVWIELTGQRGELRVRRVEPSGERSAAVTVAGLDGSRSSGYPRLAYHGGELTFAWTESSGSGQPAALQVRTATAQLPK